MNKLRILSLLPAATEMVYLLGLEKYLVGVSDDCDFPPQVKKLPKLTECLIDQNLTSKEIDKKVKNLKHQGINVSHLDEEMLKDLKPDLILTQDICPVCAISYTQVKKAARILDYDTKIISLEPESIEDILENIKVVGEFGGRKKEAVRVIEELRKRLDKVKRKIATGRTKWYIPRNDSRKVLVIEWLDPIMIAGHWAPEMVEKAGGVNLVTKPGERSKIITINQIKVLKPDILIISPCGFDIDRTFKEKELISRIVRGIKGIRGAYLIDGNSYMTRPGPRIIDGIEILSEILHPQVFLRKHTKKDWRRFVVL
ncbi:MAG: ABC transporter substrate-binding protein [Candidatus Melainabacteria bacterium]|nr:ABC transporter substrate-binding protein [Candidatus Melainabacteria bacterium]